MFFITEFFYVVSQDCKQIISLGNEYFKGLHSVT